MAAVSSGASSTTPTSGPSTLRRSASGSGGGAALLSMCECECGLLAVITVLGRAPPRGRSRG